MTNTKEIQMGGESLPIDKFDLEWMAENPSICMVAKRGAGKSWVCRDLLYHFRDIPGGIIIAPTDRMDCFYGKFFPDLYIHYAYSSEILDSLMYRQREMIKKEKTKKLEGKKVDPRSFLLMDDCLSSKGNWIKEQQISTMFFDGRHYKIMFILTMQFPLGIPPEFRSNFDYIFLLAEDFTSNKKRLFDHYAGMFPNFHAFADVFEQVTDDFGCMVLANRGPRGSFSEKVYWYKAGEVDESITIGSRQFRWIHKMNYDENWRDKEFDKHNNPDSLLNAKARTKGRIRVNKIGSIERDE